MKQPYGEGLASHTDPESCVVSREAGHEALKGHMQEGYRAAKYLEIRMSTLLSIRREGNTGGCDIASTYWTCEVKDPRHAWNVHAREPGDPTSARHEAVSGPVEEWPYFSPWSF
jgi:hypothetical protein